MQYQGIEFHVVRMIPNGWRWSFESQQTSRTGTALSREMAISKAEKAIDLAVREQDGLDQR